MRTIERTKQFQRNYRKLLRQPNGQRIEADFLHLLEILAFDQPLDSRHRDHALIGKWSGWREPGGACVARNDERQRHDHCGCDGRNAVTVQRIVDCA